MALRPEDIQVWEEYTNGIKRIETNTYVPLQKYNRIRKNEREERWFKKKSSEISCVDIEFAEPAVFSKKAKRRFQSEARFDLHDVSGNLGGVLEAFCTKCMVFGFHYATIITGKGKGICKDFVIGWLKMNTKYVSEYFEIIDSQNACGAIGIHLRNIKKYDNFR